MKTKLKVIWQILTSRTWFAVTYKFGEVDTVFAQCSYKDFKEGVKVSNAAFENAMELSSAEEQIEQQIKEALK